MELKRTKEQNKKLTFISEEISCASCKVLLEDCLSRDEAVADVSVDISQKQVDVWLKDPVSDPVSDSKAMLQKFNQDLDSAGLNYVLREVNNDEQSEDAVDSTNATNSINWRSHLLSLGAALAITIVLVLLERNSGGVLGGFASGADSVILPNLFLGLIASVSTCAAIVGGILLAGASGWQKFGINFSLFSLSRVASFAILGGLLGGVGGLFLLDFRLFTVLTVLVSIIFVIYGLVQLGLRLPDFTSARIPWDGLNFNRFAGTNLQPLFLGVITVILPCAFTLLAQGRALASGSVLSGTVIMASFAIGTLPALAVFAYLGSAGGIKNYSLDLRYLSGYLLVFLGGLNLYLIFL